MTAYSMSYFNTDQICPGCEEAERAHPDFEYALEREEAEVASGNHNHNYPGVGWPGVNGRVSRQET
jgi:hypothetical protein